MRFVVNGQSYRATPDDVRRKLMYVNPGEIRLHWVLINGRKYPLKQAFSVYTGIPADQFQSDRASRVFRQLGFTVSANPERGRQQAAKSAAIDAGVDTVNALKTLLEALVSPSITATVRGVEGELVGAGRDDVGSLVEKNGITPQLVAAVRLLTDSRNRLKQFGHAATVSLAIKALLEEGEVIEEAPTLLPSPQPSGLDLVTNVRVANFIVESCQATDEVRMRQCFVKFCEVALHGAGGPDPLIVPGKVAQLFLPSEAQYQFLRDSDYTVEWGLARSPKALREKFERAHGDPAAVTIGQFKSLSSQVQIRNILRILAAA